ncbi:MAG: FKBP-type peptidyl-prolyl cis-trans isomerase [Patescibacteria group bacterium]
MKSDTIKATEVKDIAAKFINDNLLQPGVTATIGEVTEENALYKVPVNLPDGSSVDSYMSTDGKIFFPEGMNIEEVTKQMADIKANNNQNQGQTQLLTEVVTEGTGDVVVESGDSITVDYTGTLEDGTEFDSSVGKTPFTFTIGQGTVIPGWDQGLLGMKVGEERKLIIPSDLAYGASGSGSIPPNATLIFTVKLISIN